MTLSLHPDAVLEGRAAREWYVERNLVAADGFVAEIERGLTAISDAPIQWPRYLHGTRRYLLRRFPFAIVYREAAGGVLVVAIAHAKRRPGYWHAR